MDRNKLLQYSTNKISDPREIDQIIQWIEASEENKEEYNRTKNLWAYSEFANFDDILHSEKPATPRVKLIRMEFIKYAAIFILAFLIGAATFYFPKSTSLESMAFNEVIVPLGESAEVILPDQSHVWLNSGSHLKYPSSFNGETRDVVLEGEAFFDVEHNSAKPFHVITSAITVEVLGTSFNVEANDNKEVVNVTLVEGKVNLQNRKGKHVTQLKPNQNASYNLKSNKLNISTVDVEFYTSWMHGELLFKDESLQDIASKLERWYNIKIEFDDEAVKEITFNGSILKNKPIDQILDILKYTADIDYTSTIRNKRPNIIHLKKKPM